MPNILVSTLGTWSILPEVVGFTNPDLVNLYRHHPALDRIKRSRSEANVLPVDELWVVTTLGEYTDHQLGLILGWHALLKEGNRPALKIFRVVGVSDLTSEKECRVMAEAIMRVVLHASERVAGGQTLLCLAGGRKTMSTDLQRAASVFGCSALLHVIADEKQSGQLRALESADFLEPLTKGLSSAVTPMVTGWYNRSPVLDFQNKGPDAIHGDSYPLSIPGDRGISEIEVGPDSVWLTARLDRQEREAGFLFSNYTMRMVHEEKASNFMALYGLPKQMIDRLKTTHVGVDPRKKQVELDFLKSLPKAELHCHLGGIASPEEIIEIADVCNEELEHHRDRMAGWLDRWRRRLDKRPIEELVEKIDFKRIRRAVKGVPEPLCAAAFVQLFADDPTRLDRLIYGRANQSGFCGTGFPEYEALGDMQGSGLLQSEASLRAACRVLKRKAREHNVRCLEIRCSPANYTRGGLSSEQVARIIDEEMGRMRDLSHALVFVASRHRPMSKVRQQVALADTLLGPKGEGFPSLRGFDLAGDEKALKPHALRKALMPVLERCLHVTIHAGEGQDVSGIWAAVYHLSAERIGHGLTLWENPALMERFKDRGIAVEMCPSSNFQIVGYRDSHLPATSHRATYPLKKYLDFGLRVTVNTDNPGILRTDFTNELHRAARLTEGGLSLWEIFLLIRNGFKASFLERGLKHRLMREAEGEIMSAVKERLPDLRT